jgi:hypothetical protein
MRNVFPFWALCAVALLAAACKQENKTAATAATATAPAGQTTPTAKPEIELFAVMVDKLNLRDQPNKNGKVLYQFAEGDFAEGSGGVSKEREEASLRGISYFEPYHQVTSTTPEQHSGWAYGGGLRRVYAGPRAESPDLGKLTQFSTFLKTLNSKKLESGKKAWDYVRANFADSKGSLADAAFILLEQFLFRMEREGEFYQLTEKINWKEADYRAVFANEFDMKTYPLTQSLADNGFTLATAEGMVFPTVDWRQLGAFFTPKASPAMQSYLRQSLIEHGPALFDDGGIIAPLDMVAERAVFWERFNQQNPYFPRREETEETEYWMRLILINGADNTPSYDFETLAITEDYKKCWADILQKHPGTKLAAKAKEINDLCAAEGWKRTAKVEAWQEKFAEEYSNR